MTKRALILGIGGQDGSYLADLLLEKGYEVYGLVRRSSVDNLSRIQRVLDKVILLRGDLCDYGSLENAVAASNPHEIYNEADQDAVGWSREVPSYNYDVTFKAVGNLLEIVRRFAPDARVFQPASATMFQGAQFRQHEETPLTPKSPYACAKAGAYLLARYYREAHGMFVSTGILYNHDSPRRSEEYLVHKICKSAIRIARGEQKCLKLGTLSHIVDIGHAREYMEGAWSMLQLTYADDFVLATSNGVTVASLAWDAFRFMRLDTNSNVIQEDPQFVHKGGHKEQPSLIGEIHKARAAFGFEPKLYGRELIRSMLGEMQ